MDYFLVLVDKWAKAPVLHITLIKVFFGHLMLKFVFSGRDDISYSIFCFLEQMGDNNFQETETEADSTSIITVNMTCHWASLEERLGV